MHKRVAYIARGAGVFLALFVFQVISSRLGELVANQFTYRGIDPNGTFAWISVHHMVQLFTALLIMLLLYKIFGLDFMLGAGDVKAGLRFVGKFAACFVVYTLLSIAISLLLGIFNSVKFPLNTRNVLGSLGFQLLLSGPSEEPMFRALRITLFAAVLGDRLRIKFFKWQLSIPMLLAAVLFTVAHIDWSISKQYIRFETLHLAYVFVLALVDALAYEKGKSVWYAAAVHSISNVFMVGSGYLVQRFLL